MANRNPASVFYSPFGSSRSRDTASGSPDVTAAAVAPTAGASGASLYQTQPAPARGESVGPAQLSTIQNLGNGRVLVHPLYISVEQAGDQWFAISNDLTIVGRGETELEAVDDLRAHVAELFDSLNDMRESLGPYLAGQLAFLEKLSGVR